MNQKERINADYTRKGHIRVEQLPKCELNTRNPGKTLEKQTLSKSVSKEGEIINSTQSTANQMQTDPEIIHSTFMLTP